MEEGLINKFRGSRVCLWVPDRHSWPSAHLASWPAGHQLLSVVHAAPQVINGLLTAGCCRACAPAAAPSWWPAPPSRRTAGAASEIGRRSRRNSRGSGSGAVGTGSAAVGCLTQWLCSCKSTWNIGCRALDVISPSAGSSLAGCQHGCSGRGWRQVPASGCWNGAEEPRPHLLWQNYIIHKAVLGGLQAAGSQ